MSEKVLKPLGNMTLTLNGSEGDRINTIVDSWTDQKDLFRAADAYNKKTKKKNTLWKFSGIKIILIAILLQIFRK